MCCLRYEDQTYEELKKRLPKNKTRVGTSEGPGVVVDGKILVQLVLVQLEHDGREIAVPVEELLDPNECPQPAAPSETPPSTTRPQRSGRDARAKDDDPLRGLAPEEVERRTNARERRAEGRGTLSEQQDRFRVANGGPSEPVDQSDRPEQSPSAAPTTPTQAGGTEARDPQADDAGSGGRR